MFIRVYHQFMYMLGLYSERKGNNISFDLEYFMRNEKNKCKLLVDKFVVKHL